MTAIAEWTPGMTCRVVEHDEETGQPLPGGQEYPATVISVEGELVYTGPVQGWLHLRGYVDRYCDVADSDEDRERIAGEIAA